MSDPERMDRAIRTLAENRIKAAMEEGKFDHLEGAGRPLPGLDEPYDPNWWIKKWMQRERLGREMGQAMQELREKRRR